MRVCVWVEDCAKVGWKERMIFDLRATRPHAQDFQKWRRRGRKAWRLLPADHWAANPPPTPPTPPLLGKSRGDVVPMRLRRNTCCSDVYIAAAAIRPPAPSRCASLCPLYQYMTLPCLTHTTAHAHTLTSVTAKAKLSHISSVAERKTEIDREASRSGKQQQKLRGGKKNLCDGISAVAVVSKSKFTSFDLFYSSSSAVMKVRDRW